MMSKILLGDDGEIYPEIDTSKAKNGETSLANANRLQLSVPLDQETELRLMLPQLFLLDPANTAFIAGKKMKKQQEQRDIVLPEKWFGRNGKSFWLALCLMFIWAMLGAGLSGRLHKDSNFAIEFAVPLVAGLTIILWVLYIFGWLIRLLELRSAERAERFERTHGILLKGQIIDYKRRIMFDSQTDEIRYQFVTPDGEIVRQKVVIPRQGSPDDTDRSYPIRIGTPIAILYTDDKTYKLL
jgi:hypothetical protein